MGWAAKFSICHDAMLCGSGILVRGIFFGCLSHQWATCPYDIPLVQQFAGYALVVSFMLKIIIGILPDFSIIALLLQFYIVYVVWEGSAILMKIAEKDRLRFTILSSMLLIACPAVIEFVFNKLTVVLN